MRTFYLRFHPVLSDQAYRLGVRAGEREELVTQFLGDIALRLVEAPSVPHSLAAYIITAFRHTVATEHRRQSRSNARQQDAPQAMAEDNVPVVTAGCSEYSLRAMLGGFPALHDAPHTALTTLATHLYTSMSELDQELLTWLGEHVPVSVIATWRSTTQNTVKVRISRLRAKLRLETATYLSTINEESHYDLDRFFRRAGITLAPPPAVKTITPACAHRIAHLSDVTEQTDYVSPYGPEAE